MFQSNIYLFMKLKVYIVFIQEIRVQIYCYFWVHVYAFWVHVYGSVGCKVCGCWVQVYGYFWVHVCGFWVHVYGSLGCMYAVVGCMPDSR